MATDARIIYTKMIIREKFLSLLKKKNLLERAKIVAEAFKDDDVIAEFEQEKEIVNLKYKSINYS